MNLKMRQIRMSLGLPQQEVADRAGMPIRRYGSYEREERSISLADAARIADVFDCTLDELAGRNFSSDVTYADPRQAELNDCWAEADEAQRSIILGVAQMGVGRSGADAPNETPAVEANRRQAG